jgi:hypothetical protein
LKPEIIKLGTIDVGLVETTPVVFRDRLYRFEYVRPGYSGNNTDDSYFRFVDHETGEYSAPFAHGYHLGNVMVDDDTLYVTGTDIWDGEIVDIFCSTDMVNWETWNAVNMPGWGIFNTSMCKADGKFVLMFEVGKPEEVAGVRFTARFTTSADAKNWELTPPACTYSKDRYTAPHALRYHDGFYYNFFLESVDGGWEQYVVRSRDLVKWDLSPLNPVLAADDADRVIHNPNLPREHRDRVAGAVNNNNSDIDFCEIEGRLIINYSWGNQHGIEHLAEAVYEGTEAEFLTGWFE